MRNHNKCFVFPMLQEPEGVVLMMANRSRRQESLSAEPKGSSFYQILWFSVTAEAVLITLRRTFCPWIRAVPYWSETGLNPHSPRESYSEVIFEEITWWLWFLRFYLIFVHPLPIMDGSFRRKVSCRRDGFAIPTTGEF